MKPNQSKGGSPVHQTVAEKIQFQSAGQSIQIEFTDQQLSPHAGTATFWSPSAPARIARELEALLPVLGVAHPSELIGKLKL